MKKYFIKILYTLFILFAITACTSEDWTTPSENDIPAAANINATITVDQSINQVTFSIDNEGSYPIWIFDGDEYSTVNGLTKIYSNSGTYQVEIKVGNSNGISDGSITKEFTIDNTLVDFNSFIARMAGDSSKEWVIASEEAGHISYGDSGTDGTNLYSAAANEKRGTGLYDDILTFSTDSIYTYDPGDGGTVLVNSECSVFSEYNTTGSDYTVPVEKQSSDYSFEVEGDDVFLTLPANTLFPYIPYDDSYDNPKFKIAKLTSDRMELIADNGSVAWHFILVSKSSVDADREGYDPDSDCNMWKNATITTSYYYAPGWSQIADPVMTQEGNSYTFSLPTATSDQWQAQCFLNTDISTNSANNYDFSCKLNSTKAIGNVTVKLYANGDDDTYYFVENLSLNAYEDAYVIYTDLADDTEVTVSDVVVKEHSCDDGTVIDDNTDNVSWNEDSDCNFWKTATFTNSYYYAPGWSQIDNPVMTEDGNSYTFSLAAATTDQWQAQCFFNTDIATSAENTYDFHCLLNSTTDIANVTVKLYKNGDDDTYFFTKNISLTAYEDYEFEITEMEGIDADQINLVFDFGGNPANTEVTVSSIILKESSCNDSGEDEVSWNEDSDCNFWKTATFTNSYYYAPGWSQIDDPVMTEDGNSYTFSLAAATTDQWQAQCFFNTDIATSAENTYDFHCLLNSTTDIANVTVKLYKNGDDNTYFFTNNISLTAYEDYEFGMTEMEGIDADQINLVFDFGGNPANTEVTVSEIILKESSCNE
jgi:hypothetical protein